MAIVIKTEAGFLSHGISEYSWSFSNARRFRTVSEAMSVRELLNVRMATVIKTAPRRRYHSGGIDIFPDEEEAELL